MTPEQLVETHWQKAMAVAEKFVSKNRRLRMHRDELQSRASEALWRSAKRFSSVDPSGATFWTYAGHRVNGACLDFCRELYGTRLVGPKTKVVPFTDLTEEGFRRQPQFSFLARVKQTAEPFSDLQWAKLTRCLSGHQRDIIRLRFQMGKSYSEIGKLFGIRANTVMSIVSQSIKRMRRFTAEVAA